MALMAMIAIGGISYYMMSNRAQNAKNIQRMSADDDIARALDLLNGLMKSPAHCNANFKSKRFVSPYTVLSDVKKCSAGGNCNTTGTPQTALNFNNWEMIPGSIGKARIVALSYSLAAIQSSSSSGSRARAGYANSQPAIIRLSVTFEKNLGMKAPVPPATVGTMITSRTQPYTFDAFVVTSTFTPPNTITDNPTGLIIGCARSPASTGVY